MPMFLGMILGSALTVLTVFVVDSTTTTATAVAGSPSTAETRQMVNWDVVGVRVRGLRDDLRRFGARVQDGWHRLAS